MGILKIKNFKAAAVFLDNSRRAVEQMRYYDSFLPENFTQVSNDLFSLEGVYACDAPTWKDKHTRTDRSLSNLAIIQSVKGYLDIGAEVYVYAYYGLRQEVLGMPGLTNTYWWRIVTIKK